MRFLRMGEGAWFLHICFIYLFFFGGGGGFLEKRWAGFAGIACMVHCALRLHCAFCGEAGRGGEIWG